MRGTPQKGLTADRGQLFRASFEDITREVVVNIISTYVEDFDAFRDALSFFPDVDEFFHYQRAIDNVIIKCKATTNLFFF